MNKVMEKPVGVVRGWLAWRRRSRPNKVLFSVSVFLALFVTIAFTWATLNPAPGDFARYFAFYWVWGLCAVGLLFGMAEYKTSPLRKGRERGHLFVLLYIGALLIITRALNTFLYYSP
jgi:Na+-transporting NADH:ubiquinone oxidoreductase subunit NqrB